MFRYRWKKKKKVIAHAHTYLIESKKLSTYKAFTQKFESDRIK